MFERNPIEPNIASHTILYERTSARDSAALCKERTRETQKQKRSRDSLYIFISSFLRAREKTTFPSAFSHIGDTIKIKIVEEEASSER